VERKNLQNLFENFKKHDLRALSRLLTLVENEDEIAPDVLKEIYKNSGRAYRIGITGPPGAGKSTLVNALALELKERKISIGIIAVDPTSPFTGGALLGDRIRMTKALSGTNIFMRSMASRGGGGGLARTTPQAADVMDAFGFDVVIIETVGVGQLELDVANSVDSTVVVLVPETGGSVQAMKAGLIEIADVFVINKADRDGAETLKQELLDAMSLRSATSENSWTPPVIKTIAPAAKGISELAAKLEMHLNFLKANKLLARARLGRLRKRIIELTKLTLERMLWENTDHAAFLDHLCGLCMEGKMDPYSAVELFLKRIKIIKTKDPEV